MSDLPNCVPQEQYKPDEEPTTFKEMTNLAETLLDQLVKERESNRKLLLEIDRLKKLDRK